MLYMGRGAQGRTGGGWLQMMLETVRGQDPPTAGEAIVAAELEAPSGYFGAVALDGVHACVRHMGSVVAER